MRNPSTKFKTLLKMLPLQEQIDGINDVTKKLVNKKYIANIRDSRYEIIKEPKHIRENLKIKRYA